MKLAKLGMNEYEKMANELIEKKEKLDCNLENFFLKISIILLHLSPLIALSNNKLNAILDNILLILIFVLVFTLSVSFIGVGIIALFYKLKKKKELLKDEEYQLAKEIVRLYQENKIEQKNKEKIRLGLLEKEKKEENIKEFEKFLEKKIIMR